MQKSIKVATLLFATNWAWTFDDGDNIKYSNLKALLSHKIIIDCQFNVLHVLPKSDTQSK